MSADTNLRLYGSFASNPAIAPDRATLDCTDPPQCAADLQLIVRASVSLQPLRAMHLVDDLPVAAEFSNSYATNSFLRRASPG
jgi:hypothetical protein